MRWGTISVTGPIRHRPPTRECHEGYLVINPADPINTDWWSVRFSSEYGTDFDSLSRIGTRLVFDTSTRFGFDTEWNQWIESIPGGDDSLATGDFNLVYRFAQNEQIQFYSGVGANWMTDSQRLRPDSTSPTAWRRFRPTHWC